MIPLIELATAPFVFIIQLIFIKPIESLNFEKVDLDKNLLTNSK